MPDDMKRPLAVAAAMLGDKWTILIVDALMAGPRTFGELQEAVGGISPNVLSARLKRLSDDDLVSAKPYSQRPPRYSYELSERGADLRPALAVLSSWAAAGSSVDLDAGDRHSACGSHLTARMWCPTCDVAADNDGPSDIEV
jgi:DNA-binding HxlR family transcriptional regulator